MNHDKGIVANLDDALRVMDRIGGGLKFGGLDEESDLFQSATLAGSFSGERKRNPKWLFWGGHRRDF